MLVGWLRLEGRVAAGGVGRGVDCVAQRPGAEMWCK